MTEQSSLTAPVGVAKSARGAEDEGGQRAAFLPSFALLVVTYSLAAIAGLQWATVSGAASPIWPAAGIAVACILNAGRRMWPGIVVGLVIAAQVTGASHSLPSQLMMGFGNAVAALAAAELLRRFGGPQFVALASVRSVMLLIAVAVVGAAIAAINGTIALVLSEQIPRAVAAQVLQTWFFGDAVGIIMVAALILTWRTDIRSRFRSFELSHLLLICGAVALLAWYVFFGSDAARAWAVYPALVWAALALRVQGATVALILAAVLACAGTALGLGPFGAGPDAAPDYRLLQQFLAVTSATTLLLAAAVHERNTEASLREVVTGELAAREAAFRTQQRLSLALEASSTGMWEWEVATGQTSWSAEVYPIMGVESGRFDGTAEGFDALLHPDDRERVWATVTAAMEQREPYLCEFRIVRPDGEVRWVLNRGRGIHDEAGKPVRMIGTISDISDQVRQREELERTSSLLQLIGASAPIAIYAKDVEGRYLYANKVVAAATGTEEGELVGRTDRDWAPPDVAAALIEHDRTAMHSGEACETEEVVRHPDGQERTYRALKAPLRDRDGKVIGLVGVSADITEHKQAEEQLARLAERAEIAQQAARSSLYDFDLVSGAVERDPLLWTLAGYDPAEMSAAHESWAQLVHPEDRTEFDNTVEKALERAERFAMEYRVVRASGEVLWVSDVGRIIRDGSGKPVRIVGLASDVTERKQAEEDLRRTHAMLQLIGDSAGGLIFAKDREGRYIYCNSQVAKITGRSLDELRGLDDRSWADPELAELYMGNDRRVMETGVAEELDELAIAPDGSQRLYRSMKAPLRDGNGAVIGIVGVSTDITDRKALEEREQLLAREVDHRAKNLLAVVQSVVQMSRADDLDTFKAGVAGRIQSLARAHSLLAASRWEGVELTQLVRDELAPFRTDDGSRIVVEGPAVRLGPAAGQSIALVLHELATNAAKYGSLSNEAGRLAVRWSRPRRRNAPIRLEWSEQGGRPTQPPSRSGFGSRLIRASVERQLGGELAYHWGEDGLSVQLLIPALHVLSTADGDVCAGEQGSSEPLPVTASAPGARVLVVEDEALVGLHLEEALEEAGCEVIGVVATVDEALDLIAAERLDGALLDINLAGEKSFAVAERLADAGVPFAFCTGYAGGTVLPDRFAETPLLRKPVDGREIAALFRGGTGDA